MQWRVHLLLLFAIFIWWILHTLKLLLHVVARLDVRDPFIDLKWASGKAGFVLTANDYIIVHICLPAV